MDADNSNLPAQSGRGIPGEVIWIELIPDSAEEQSLPPPRPPRRIWLPLALFLVTCASTLAAGIIFSDRLSLDDLWPAVLDGAMYSAAVMTILFCHEMGHFLFAWRHGVYATLPYFIPMPLTPIGTFGAVIAMEPRRGNRKALFDIGIAGPLAGLAPTLVLLWLGLQWSRYRPIGPDDIVLGEPLIVQFIASLMHGPIPAGHHIAYHPIAFAGWVGLLITSVNLIPIGQLDGGHILYGMFRKTAHAASVALLVAAIYLSIQWKLTQWWLMLGLIALLGTRHPPTADDSIPLGAWRYVLGALTLAFIVLGFTPVPMRILGEP